jgi:16S rRNA (guanine527-N7)-methyltransferase
MADRGTPLARGPGRPDREPDEPRQTDATPSLRLRRRRERRADDRTVPHPALPPGPREPLPTRISDLPELPLAARDALADGLAALDLGLASGPRLALEGQVRLLLAWTRGINLTAIRDPVAAVTLHVLDSLTAVPLLRASAADRLLDLGSGAGYPGIPLAVAIPARAVLVESVGKKAAFLDTLRQALGIETTIRVERARAERLAADPANRESWPIVTARAVGTLDELVELAFPLMRIGGRLVAWKRGDLAAELRAGERAAAWLGGGRLTIEPVRLPALRGHVLVVVEKLGPTPGGFPRDAGTRRRRPW